MKVEIVFVILAKLLTVTAEQVAKQVIDSRTYFLIDLGSVDGKNYFYDKETSRNWFEARDFCIESGMKLATIETASQAEFLKSKYHPALFNGVFWTAARDAQTARQFTWDHTGTEPTNATGLDWIIYGGNLDYQTCVYYASQPSPVFYLRDCTLGVGDTLCEM